MQIPSPQPSPAGRGSEEAPARPRWLPAALGAVLLLLAALYSPRPASAAAPGLLLQPLPAGLQVTAWPLAPEQQQWLDESGVEAAERWRFEWRGLQGSLLLVSSFTWRAQHRPERCFEVYGLEVDQSSTQLMAPDFPVRLLTLRGPAEPLGAAYWLQSMTTATDDYAARIWADLAPQRQRWVLATILFDNAPDPGAAPAPELYLAVRQMLERALAAPNLNGGQNP